MTFIKNSFYGLIIPWVYNNFLSLIKNTNTKLVLKEYLYSIKHSFFLGSISILSLYNLIGKQHYYSLLGFSNGYLIFDLIRAIKFKDYQMIFHHAFMMFTIISTQVVSDDYVPKLEWIMGRIYICEFTNIFLYSYIMLNKLQFKNKNIMNFLKITTVISYLFLRIYNFNYIQYYLFINRIYICFYLMLPITTINYYWFMKIISKSIKNI